ncbi:hypothetical protein GsuE55_37720 (plasmid) [Geobacillus subterraneus]|uniref:Uncharacterized protein n=1 Tax=Geobacillus subterraneus TaxID=129338 RepID=A0A679FVD4_9BACL|nr:hypothetical protein GsuE55_37720 [Geobacillus subterraneus]
MRNDVRGQEFRRLTRLLAPVLKQEGIPLSFRGYEEMVWRCEQMIEHHVADVYELARDCLHWAHYLSELKTLLCVLCETWQERLSFWQVRCSETQERTSISLIRELKKQIDLLKTYIDLLDAERVYFLQMHFLCMQAFRKTILL